MPYSPENPTLRLRGAKTLDVKKAGIAASRLFIGADETNRTSDLLITNQLLYRLSYISKFG